MTKKNDNIYQITFTALMSAVAIVLYYLEFNIAIMPSFIKFDFSDVPALITSFVYGPLYGIAVSFVKNIIHLFFSYTPTTFGIGELSNFILSVFLILPISFFYKKENKKELNLLLGCISGSVLMGILSIFSNYYIVYPVYTNIMPLETIISLYKIINPYVENLWQCLIYFNAPFTLCKGLISSIISILLFKFLKKPLKNLTKNSKI